MKEIKFRYTCKRDNGWIFSEIFTLNQIENGEVSLWIKVNIIKEEQITREQFTSFYDKNKKEVYNGDIIRTDSKIIRHVIWNESSMEWTTITQNGIVYPLAHWIIHENTTEVIGNVHKNVELLEEL